MVWQPTQRVWAGDDIPIDDKELENDAMQGVESTHSAGAKPGAKSTTGTGTGTGSARSQSMSISATASVSGVEADEDDV
jgi:histone-binding protein RBBP4